MNARALHAAAADRASPAAPRAPAPTPASNPTSNLGGHAGADPVLLWAALLLLAFGLVMVYSSSVAIAGAESASGFEPTYFLRRHAVFVGIGLLLGGLALRVPMQLWQELAPYLFVFGVVLLMVVLIPGIGREVNGSRRWLSLGVANLQPSELMKLFAVLYAADYTVRKAAFMDSFRRGFVPMLTVMLLVSALLLSEPDFGAFAVIVCVTLAILFLGGLNLKQFGGLFIMLLAGFLALIAVSPYRLRRIVGFLDPWADPYGAGYQLSHALIAFGRGEWLGVGLGASVEKLFYLPEAHTDFLLAVIAEELGFLGVLAVSGLFALLVVRCFRIAHAAVRLDRPFNALVAQGVGVWLGAQAVVNMGVNMGVLPTKGLTLPLMSFGGSSIVANCVALALVLRVAHENRLLCRGRAP